MKTPKEIPRATPPCVRLPEITLSEFLDETFDAATQEEIQVELEIARIAAIGVCGDGEVQATLPRPKVDPPVLQRVDEDDEVFSPPGGSYRNVEWVPNKQPIKGR